MVYVTYIVLHDFISFLLVNPGYRDAHQEPTADYDDHQDLRYRHGNRDPDLDTPVRPHHGDYMRDYSGPIELSALPSRQMGNYFTRFQSHSRGECDSGL